MSKKAMQQALEALQLNNYEWKYLADSGDAGNWKAEEQDHYQQTSKAIIALQEELEKLEKRNQEFLASYGKFASNTGLIMPDEKTLRDEFAMAVITGLSSIEKAVDNATFEQLASYAYQQADEMMKERAK